MKNLLEHLLRKAGRELAELQVARFWKFPEELQKTPCDFMGFTATGRAILIEAKMVVGTSLPISNTPGLAPHQFVALDEANKAGAVSLLCWAQDGVCATLSFDMVLALSKGRLSIPWDKIEEKYLRSITDDKAYLHLLDHWLTLPDRVVCP